MLESARIATGVEPESRAVALASRHGETLKRRESAQGKGVINRPILDPLLSGKRDKSVASGIDGQIDIRRGVEVVAERDWVLEFDGSGGGQSPKQNCKA